MPSRINLLHSTLLTTSIIGVFLWSISQTLHSYTFQLVGALTLIYASTHWFKRKFAKGKSITLDLTLLTTMILLLVTETGGLPSAFFFTLYFLLFAVAMLEDIETTLLLTAALILYFLLHPTTNLSDLSHLTGIIALLMITPLAIYTGHQYEKVLITQNRMRTLSDHLSRLETDSLIFLSLNLKRTLLSSLDSLSQVIPQIKVRKLRGEVEELYLDLRSLYRSANELQELIDQETDK